MTTTYLTKLVLLLVFALISFFLMAGLIMLTYNNSIPVMNNNWKEMSYKTAMIFTLFVAFISVYFRSYNYSVCFEDTSQ